ncbi:RepA [Rice latent virus 2]|uniref:Replication-associated protein n=1 Tax=Rice latent virus 2 TaxID=2012857 RepID=A0A2D0WZF4_9GEMI|nr:RepA [Rice latent virus 2]ASA49175.1 RepA [Rice latent virus 2]
MTNTESASEQPHNFAFQNKNVFLTYPRCSQEPHTMGLFLWNLLRPYGVLCASELHKDGTPHLHALAQTRHRIRTHDSSFFDNMDYHPNIQGTRNPKAVLAYILKHPTGEWHKGSFRPRGSFGVPPTGNGEAGPSTTIRRAAGDSSSSAEGGNTSSELANKRRRMTKDQIMADILRSATSRMEYMNGVKKWFPYDYCARLQAWEYASQKLFPDPPVTYEPPFNDSMFHCHETLTEWAAENIYHVTPQVYSLLHPHSDAEADLRWLHDTCFASRRDQSASTSADHQGQESLLGLEASADTITTRIT